MIKPVFPEMTLWGWTKVIFHVTPQETLIHNPKGEPLLKGEIKGPCFLWSRNCCKCPACPLSWLCLKVVWRSASRPLMTYKSSILTIISSIILASYSTLWLSFTSFHLYKQEWENHTCLPGFGRVSNDMFHAIVLQYAWHSNSSIIGLMSPLLFSFILRLPPPSSYYYYHHLSIEPL